MIRFLFGAAFVLLILGALFVQWLRTNWPLLLVIAILCAIAFAANRWEKRRERRWREQYGVDLARHASVLRTFNWPQPPAEFWQIRNDPAWWKEHTTEDEKELEQAWRKEQEAEMDNLTTAIYSVSGILRARPGQGIRHISAADVMIGPPEMALLDDLLDAYVRITTDPAKHDRMPDLGMPDNSFCPPKYIPSENLYEDKSSNLWVDAFRRYPSAVLSQALDNRLQRHLASEERGALTAMRDLMHNRWWDNYRWSWWHFRLAPYVDPTNPSKHYGVLPATREGELRGS